MFFHYILLFVVLAVYMLDSNLYLNIFVMSLSSTNIRIGSETEKRVQTQHKFHTIVHITTRNRIIIIIKCSNNNNIIKTLLIFNINIYDAHYTSMLQHACGSIFRSYSKRWMTIKCYRFSFDIFIVTHINSVLYCLNFIYFFMKQKKRNEKKNIRSA